MAPVKKQKANKSPKTTKKAEDTVKPAVVSGQVIITTLNNCSPYKTC